VSKTSVNQLFDIICFSTTDWDEIWGSRQQIMSRLATRGHRVFFVERPAGLEHLWRYPDIRKNKMERWRQGVKNIVDNIWIISLPPLVPGRYYSTGINAINQWITQISVKSQLSGFKIDSPVLWIYNPEQGNLIGKFNERLSVYHCIDEFTAGTSGRKKRIISQLENQLLSRVDIVLANSQPTYQNKHAINPNTYRISSGVDFDLFTSSCNDEEISSILSKIPHPRIGFVGNVNDRIDFPLIESLTIQRPSWSFVFVGGTFPLSSDNNAVKRLKSIPNCYFLGKKSYQQVPAFIDGFDVCFLPFVQDERAYFRSPLKLYEYFAAGKPVVATPLPETQEFSNCLYLADSPQQFVAELEKALFEYDPSLEQKRKLIARQNSWDVKVDMIEKIIQDSLR
jgi:glycosyltransferase involved in cell wall biosynthesis